MGVSGDCRACRAAAAVFVVCAALSCGIACGAAAARAEPGTDTPGSSPATDLRPDAPAPGPRGALASRDALIEIGRPPRAPSALDSIPHPWPGAAILLSAAGTAIPIVAVLEANRPRVRTAAFLGLLGVEVLTPATGHVYGGVLRDAIPGALLRGAGFTMVAAGVARGAGDGSSEFGGAVIVLIAGVGLEAAGAVVDVLTVGDAVERRNARLARHDVKLGFGVTPSGREPALVVRARF